ncbi:PleD family two-component system response regulator [Acidobacteriota bacterium]
MPKKVLVIDDDVNTVKFLKVALEQNGYEALSAPDGKAGLELVKESPPDLILLDVMMPRKTGFGVFRTLKRDEKYKDIPIIMVTGVAETLEELEQEKEDTFARPYDSLRNKLAETIKELKGEGLVKPEMFLDKPIDPEVLIEKVRNIIGS